MKIAENKNGQYGDEDVSIATESAQQVQNEIDKFLALEPNARESYKWNLPDLVYETKTEPAFPFVLRSKTTSRFRKQPALRAPTEKDPQGLGI
jgi:hypothetical protein